MNFEAIGPDCVSRSEENVCSYFKAGGWSSCPQPATHKDKQAHLGRGHCPNEARDTSGAAFRLKRKRDKGSPTRLRRGAHTTPGGMVPAHPCLGAGRWGNLIESLMGTPGAHPRLWHMCTQMHTCVLTFIHTHSWTCSHTHHTPTLTHVHTNVNAHA